MHVLKIANVKEYDESLRHELRSAYDDVIYFAYVYV